MSRDLVLARTMLRDIVRYSCRVGLLKQIPFRLPKLILNSTPLSVHSQGWQEAQEVQNCTGGLNLIYRLIINQI